MVINTAIGVQRVPQDYMNVARVLNLSEWKIATKILLPWVLTYMLTGVRLAVGTAWLVIVSAEMLTGGVLLCATRAIRGPAPERAVVFQNHSLLPWLTCYENVHLPVERVFAKSETKAQLKERTDAARALSIEPRVLRMDEPFGALDALTRAKLQDELLDIVARTRSTVVMVTHAVNEAVQLSDKIVMMTHGPAAQARGAGQRPRIPALPQGRDGLPLHPSVACGKGRLKSSTRLSRCAAWAAPSSPSQPSVEGGARPGTAASVRGGAAQVRPFLAARLLGRARFMGCGWRERYRYLRSIFRHRPRSAR